MIQNEADNLKIKEKVTKAKTRIPAHNNIELESGNKREHRQPKPLEYSCWKKSIRMINGTSRVTKIELEQES